MKKWFSNLTVVGKSTFLSIIISLIVFLICVPLFFFSLHDIPLGILIGCLLSIIFYFFLGRTEQKDQENGRMNITVVLQILRFIAVAGLLILFVILDFKLKIKLFNPFGFIGGYMVPTIVLIIVSLKARE